MRRSIATVSLSGTLEEKLRAAAAAGFDGVEMFESDLVGCAWPPEAVRALAEAANLKGTSRKQLREGLAAIHGLATPVGKLTFDSKGQFQPTQSGWVTVRGGRWVSVPNLGAA